MDPKDSIKRFALRVGFDLCGITTAAAPDHGGYLREWIADGKHGGMEWLARNTHKRINPQEVLPGAKSVIVVGLNYGDDDAGQIGQSSSQAIGRIARYARGVDYHPILGRKLRAIEQYISGQFHAKTLSYVDTGPVLERDLAARAGMGWQGKSTMLVSPQIGTYFFIGEILTTLGLEPDVPQKNRCGSCTRCIMACPTAAITAPYQMDARRCISYLTIENKGSIPEEFRPLIGDRIFGCDDCLEVCPWNRFAQVSRTAQFAGNQWTRRPILSKLLGLGQEEFNRIFQDSPIKRVKHRGLLRNVCVALGNTGDGSDMPALKKALEDSEPLVREHADWAIRQIQKRAATLG